MSLESPSTEPLPDDQIIRTFARLGITIRIAHRHGQKVVDVDMAKLTDAINTVCDRLEAGEKPPQ